MPALDQCHPHVVRALTKAGWLVAPKPFAIKIKRGHTLFVDLEAFDPAAPQVILLVEVKCFPYGSADTTELYTALGQYIVYRGLLRQRGVNAVLYLAIPVEAFQDIFARMAVNVIAENQIKMVVIDMDREVIVQWLM